MTIDARLQEMLDHHDIRRVLNEYCQACDRLDFERLSDVYWEDAWEDHGSNKCPAVEFVPIVTAALASTTSMCSHLLGQSIIEVDGDEAGAETYFIATVRDKGADGQERLNEMGGRYVDRLARREGHWRLLKRICVRDWSISFRPEEDWLAGGAHVRGTRSFTDPVYAALGRRHSGEVLP